MGNKNNMSATELRRSLNLVILAVTFGMAFFVIINGPPFTGFIRTLGAGDLVFGVIMAMPVVGGVIQVFASYVLEMTGKRKLIFLVGGFIHRALWIPVALIPLLVPLSHNALRIWAITVLITISSAGNSVVGISFMSWMGAIVPMDIRGRFFSKRTAISTISSAVAGLAAGKLLDSIHSLNGFAIVLCIAALMGISDIACFIWIKDPPMEVPKERIPFFELFVMPYRNRNYMRFIIFITVWNFGLNFAGPFFNVYMLEHLKMSYFIMALFGQITANISTILFVRVWGRIIDKYGNKPVMAMCCTVVITLPFLWCFATPQNYFIVLIINFFSGIFWPGIDMTSLNLSIWLAPEKNKSIFMANYTLITSIFGIALAYVCGGAFLEFVKPILASHSLPFIAGQTLNGFHMLFIGSGSIRLLSFLIFFPKVHEDNSTDARDVLKDISDAAKQKVGAISGK